MHYNKIKSNSKLYLNGVYYKPLGVSEYQYKLKYNLLECIDFLGDYPTYISELNDLLYDILDLISNGYSDDVYKIFEQSLDYSHIRFFSHSQHCEFIKSDFGVGVLYFYNKINNDIDSLFYEYYMKYNRLEYLPDKKKLLNHFKCKINLEK